MTLGSRSGTCSSKRALVDSKSDRLSNVTTARSMCLQALKVILVPLLSGSGQEWSLFGPTCWVG